MPHATGKILVIRGGAIGDFILTLPVLAALRGQFPGIHLEILGYPHIAQLALAGGLADQVHSIEARPLARFFARGGRLPEPLAEYFQGFALIVSYLYDPDRIFQENVARCSKAQFLVGPHRPDEGGDVHATEVFLRPLTRLAIFDADPTPRLQMRREQADAFSSSASPVAAQTAPAGETSDDGARVLHHVNGFEQREIDPASAWLAVHPGSGSERKNWPEQKWSDLLRQLVEVPDLNFLLIGGEAEGERLDQLAGIIPPLRRKVARSLPLPKLAVLLDLCRGYIGHDSGITHLAAAVGLRSLVLWGETREQVWRPRGDRVRLLRAPEGLAALPVQAVLAGVREHLAG